LSVQEITIVESALASASNSVRAKTFAVKAAR
jgi:hypothetical protein